MQTHYFNGSAAQQWYVTNLGGGEYRIMSNLNRSYSLDVNSWNNANGTNVQIWQTTNDKFKLRKEGGHYADGTPVNKHIIISSFSDNRVLDVYRGNDSSKYDINVQIWGLAQNNTNQYWEFYPYYSDKHASPNTLDISAVVWKSNTYTSTPPHFQHPENASRWGYHFINKISTDTWKKILLPAPTLKAALAKAVGTTARKTVLKNTGGFTDIEISKIGVDILVNLISVYAEWVIDNMFYDNAVTAMKNSGNDGIKAETVTFGTAEAIGSVVDFSY